MRNIQWFELMEQPNFFTNNSENKEIFLLFSPCNERKDKIRVPVRNRTSDLWITRCEAQSQTNRDSKVS